MEEKTEREIFEWGKTRYWFEDGIAFIQVKDSPEVPDNERDQMIRKFMQQSGGKRCCAVFDLTESSPVSQKRRVYNSDKLPMMFSAIAFIAKSGFEKMLAALYSGSKPLPIPCMLFKDKKEAVEWIKQFRDEKEN